MKLLRRLLFWQAAVWTAAGLALIAFPKPILMSLFEQRHFVEDAWVRIAGVMAVGLAMLEVLVAQRLEDLWWFSWAFAITTAGVGVVVLANAAFGVDPESSVLLWWLLSAVATAFTAGLLWGMARAGQERPFPDS